MDPTSLRMIQGASGTGGVAAIEFVASAQAGTAASTLTINKPAGVQSGDLLIALCGTKAGRTWTGDTGWTEVIDQGVAPSTRVAYLIAGGSEPATYTFTSSSSDALSGVIAAFRYAAYDTIGTISTTATSGVQTAPAITLSTSSSAIFAFFANSNSDRSWSNPTSGLVSTASDSDTDAPSWALYRELDLSSGSTGTRSATCSSTSGNSGCILVGIKPA